MLYYNDLGHFRAILHWFMCKSDSLSELDVITILEWLIGNGCYLLGIFQSFAICQLPLWQILKPTHNTAYYQ